MFILLLYMLKLLSYQHLAAVEKKYLVERWMLIVLVSLTMDVALPVIMVTERNRAWLRSCAKKELMMS